MGCTTSGGAATNVAVIWVILVLNWAITASLAPEASAG